MAETLFWKDKSIYFSWPNNVTVHKVKSLTSLTRNKLRKAFENYAFRATLPKENLLMQNDVF